MIPPDRDEDYVVITAGVRHYVGFGVDAPATENVTGAHAPRGHFASPPPVTQHRDLVSRGRNMGAVYGTDHAGTYDEQLQGELPKPVV